MLLAVNLVLAEPRLVSLYTALACLLSRFKVRRYAHTNTRRPIMYMELVRQTAVAA